MTEQRQISASGKDFEINNPEKLLFPDDGITKSEMVDYYTRIAPAMLPHLKGRAIVMLRYPEGINGESFFHKETPAYFPSWIERISLPKEGGRVNYVVCDEAADLAYIAGQACITPHIWLSRYDLPYNPDLLIFDLDPSEGVAFGMVRQAAFTIKEFLTELGLASFVKTTGSRGLHVTCPLDREATFDDSRTFAEDVAKYLAEKDPEHLTVEAHKKERGKRILIDALRNSYGQTAVAPFALRARPGAPVATPISWEELNNPALNSQTYNMKNIFHRLVRVSDPWKDMWNKVGSIKHPWKKLKALADKQ
jgi:bifunctional non-homologous end joining protein LigD